MKKIGTINQPLSAVIAGMGHGDMLVIADCGLPIPAEVPRIDLALTAGIPGFLQTLAVIQQELQVESAVIATEMPQSSPELYTKLMPMLAGIEVAEMNHEQFKELTQLAVAVVRTGECTPYANIILKSGVIF
ncbi:D-ribose pyranase [Sporomusaceae bacterium FL31]|nr:D-ribose pyranase [Sporomusaceae bacterium FL31]GCE32990.1 D-ribose pyranase [Sporomusaceae bacterium]